MPGIIYTNFIKIGLLVFALLCSGCALQYRAEQEAQRNALLEQQRDIEKQQLSLRKERRELKAKQAELAAESESIAQALEELSQEQRKLEVLKKSIPSASPVNTSANLKPVEGILIGQLEKVYLEPPGLQFTARIDTGARTSSLNALNLTEFERDGKDYASFQILHPKSGEPVELTRQVLRHKKIKDHDGIPQVRPVVKMRVILGEIDQRIKFTLIDRSEFKHQVLIGRNFLTDFAIVDVSKKYVTTPTVTP